MNIEEFIKGSRNLPVIDTELFLPGLKNPKSFKVQISRWVKSGKVIQLRRGLYLLGEPYRTQETNEFHIASVLHKPSYISLEKALEYYGLIPERVTVMTSVTTKRPCMFETPVGTYDYRHIKSSLWWGYTSTRIGKQISYIATPEKAFLDYIYLRRPELTVEFFVELRLQHLSAISIKKLERDVEKFDNRYIARAVRVFKEYRRQYKQGDKIA